MLNPPLSVENHTRPPVSSIIEFIEFESSPLGFAEFWS